MLDRPGLVSRTPSETGGIARQKKSVTACSDLTIWTECLNPRQMVTRCKFPTARGWNCGRCEAKSPFIFVLEKGRAFHLHRALTGRSYPVGCWHFAIALTHALQKRPSPMLDRPGVVAR